MMKRRTVRYVGVLTACGVIAAACAGGESDPAAGEDSEAEATVEEDSEAEATVEEVIEATLPHHMAAGSLDDDCINDFTAAVEDQTDGGIVFTVTPGGALGGEADVHENLFDGIFEASFMSSVLMGVWHEPAQVLTLPYVFTDIADARDVLNSDLMQPVYEGLLDEKGARLLGWCHFSLRNIAANNAITEPADLAGLRIRVPETPSFVETFSELGANPTPLPYPEVYTNLQTGVVDAVDSSFSAMYDTNIHEVAKDFSETRHIFTSQGIVVNEEWYQSLTPEQQQILSDAARTAEEEYVTRFIETEEEVIPLLEDAGVTVTRDVDIDALRDAVADARASLASRYGVEELLADIEAMLG